MNPVSSFLSPQSASCMAIETQASSTTMSPTKPDSASSSAGAKPIAADVRREKSLSKFFLSWVQSSGSSLRNVASTFSRNRSSGVPYLFFDMAPPPIRRDDRLSTILAAKPRAIAGKGRCLCTNAADYVQLAGRSLRIEHRAAIQPVGPSPASTSRAIGPAASVHRRRGRWHRSGGDPSGTGVFGSSP